MQAALNKLTIQFNEKLESQQREHSATINSLRTQKAVIASQLEQSHGDRLSLHSDLKKASNYIEKVEQRVLEANNQSLDLLKRVRDLELENDTLRNYIIDLKARVSIYVPVRNDDTDMRLAEYINNYPDRSKLKIMFMREQEGVYTFGSKRVNVRVEKGRILIRIGGGYCSIDEFLDQHTPTELEKLERRDPLKRYAEKVAISKAIEGHDISPAKRI